jgi:hypothetical protein
MDELRGGANARQQQSLGDRVEFPGVIRSDSGCESNYYESAVRRRLDRGDETRGDY